MAWPHLSKHQIVYFHPRSIHIVSSPGQWGCLPLLFSTCSAPRATTDHRHVEMSTAWCGPVLWPKANGTHSFPAAQHRHSQRWGPNHSPTSRLSGHHAPCWSLSSSILANCSSPELWSLIPPLHAVPAFLQVSTVSASLCHPYLCLFGKLTPVQFVASVLLELLN